MGVEMVLSNSFVVVGLTGKIWCLDQSVEDPMLGLRSSKGWREPYVGFITNTG